jgi:hypothetical protein
MISACALLSVVRGPLKKNGIVGQPRPTATPGNELRAPARRGRRDASDGLGTKERGPRSTRAGAMPATDNGQRTTDKHQRTPTRQARRDPSNGQQTTDNGRRTKNKGHRPARSGAIPATDNGQRTTDKQEGTLARQGRRDASNGQRTTDHGQNEKMALDRGLAGPKAAGDDRSAQA